MPFSNLGRDVALGLQVRNSILDREAEKSYKESLIAAKERQQYIDLLTARTAERKSIIEADTLKFQKGKEFFDVFGKLNAGRTDITPDEVKAQTDLFDKLFGVPSDKSSAMYKPITDKMGEIKSYRFDNAESVKSEFDNLLKKAQTDREKADTVLKQLEQKKTQNEIAMGNVPKTSIEAMQKELYASKEFQKASQTEKIQMLSELPWKLPTAATQTSQGSKELQDSVVSTLQQTHDLNRIAEVFDERMLTYSGKLWNFATREGVKTGIIKKLSPEDEKFHTDFKLLQSASNRILNRYTNDISGAAFSIKEMERYEKSIFTMKDDKYEYKAAFNDFVQWGKKSYRVKDMILGQGFKGSREELGKEIDKVMSIGDDPTLDPQIRNKRGDNLATFYRAAKPDAKDEEIRKMVAQQLLNEGYK